MSGTWWVNQNELDEDQLKIISLPLDEDIFVTGPPGSGKTNLLLLRANYLYRAGRPNIAVVTFTRSLKEFIASGAARYAFPASKVMTSRQWQHDVFNQYGWNLPQQSGDFEQDRLVAVAEMSRMVEQLSLSKIFDAILLDEAQDYLPDEILIFRRMAHHLFCVADKRQKIYKGQDSIEAITKCIGVPYCLKYHYRNGLKICRVADEIAKPWPGFQPLSTTSNYNEKSNPSTVDSYKCNSVAEQAALIIDRLATQRAAFPDELIGVLCPTKESRNLVWEAISESQHAGAAFLLDGTGDWPLDKQIIVSTFHAAKGLEFRALHLAACDELTKAFFNNNRSMSYTAVTRAKTALSVYHCGSLHGYFEAALETVKPAPTLPSLDDLFGGKP